MILYGPEHQFRAGNLARVLNEPCAAIASAEIARPQDKTLTIWGHGGPDTFAGLDHNSLRDLIVRWKARNPQFTSVELVTCDARHLEGGEDSYTDKLMSVLIVGGKIPVTIKTLPRGGSTATWSTLWAVEAAGSDGFYFVAGETKDAMDRGAAVLHQAEADVDKPTALPIERKFPAAIQLAKTVNERNTTRTYVTTSGLFGQLRDTLVPVTAYTRRDNRGVKTLLAVPKVLS